MNRVTVRHNVNPDTLDDDDRDIVNLRDGKTEINVVLDGKLAIQIMLDAAGYTIFDAEFDGIDGAL